MAEVIINVCSVKSQRNVMLPDLQRFSRNCKRNFPFENVDDDFVIRSLPVDSNSCRYWSHKPAAATICVNFPAILDLKYSVLPIDIITTKLNMTVKTHMMKWNTKRITERKSLLRIASLHSFLQVLLSLDAKN